MTEKGLIDVNNRSISHVIKYLTENFTNSEIELLKTRELLRIRNKVLHEQYYLTKLENKEFLEFEDNLINKLEIAQK